MAAIRPFREEVVDEELPGGASGSTVEVPGLEQSPQASQATKAFGILSTFPSPAARQAELTRLLWMRQELERAMASSRYAVEAYKGRAHIQLYDAKGDPLVIPADFVPWFAGPVEHGRYAFFTENGKMGVGTWDLPAGAPHFGGSCPAATASQLLVPEADRKRYARAMLPPPGSPEGASTRVDEDKAICGVCYAGKGNYPSPHVQMRELIAFWWVQELFKQDRQDEFVETMAEAIIAENQRLTPQGIRPFRIHSSGDFFTPAYFEAWIEVSKRVHRMDSAVRLWAPTRCWSHKGFDWSLLREVPREGGKPVLMVRPSAYHIGDPAPAELDEGSPLGTTAIFHADNAGMSDALEEIAWKNQSPEGRAWLKEHFDAVRTRKGLGWGRGRDRRYIWNCQAYAVGSDGEDLAHSCANATGPDGKVHCRACWTDPELSICYTVH